MQLVIFYVFIIVNKFNEKTKKQKRTPDISYPSLTYNLKMSLKCNFKDFKDSGHYLYHL